MERIWTESELKMLSDKEFLAILEEGTTIPEKLVRKLPRNRKRLYHDNQKWTVEALNFLSEQAFIKLLDKGVVLQSRVVRCLERERKILYHRADTNSVFFGLGVVVGIWEKKLQVFKVRVNPQGEHLPPVVRKRRFFFTATA